MSDTVKIFLYPPISNQDDADKIVSRLAWYLAPHLEGVEGIYLCETRPGLIDSASLAENLDPLAADLMPDVKRVVRNVPREALVEGIKSANVSEDVFFIWNAEVRDAPEPWLDQQVNAFRAKGGFYEIDPDRTRMEGSFLLWAGLNKLSDANALTAEHKLRLEKMVSDVGQHERAYVFGTGPSFSDFVSSHDFSDGLTIVANSIVKNVEALEILKPKIICAADPIYHAGVSSYAGAFRTELIAALEMTGAWFVCPMRDFPIYQSCMPVHLRDRIVAIPFNAKVAPPIDLTETFHLSPYPNVLTLALLPLASTFADKISVIGCDGRKLLDDAFFWSHDKKVQFNDKLVEIQAAHPAFFKIDYNDYYMDHCRDLEFVLNELEESGKTVESLTPSLIPALDYRYTDQHAVPHGKLACFAMIDPDAKDDWGHFLAYDKRIGETVTSKGVDFALICRTELDYKFRPETAKHFLPVFNTHSWTIGNKVPVERSKVLEFAKSLDTALSTLEAEYETGIIELFFYVGSVEAAEAIEHLLTFHPRVKALINLFWSYNFDQNASAYRKVWRPLVKRQNNSKRVTISHSTPQIAEEFKRDWGIDIDVLPHPSTTFSDDEAEALSRKPLTGGTSAKKLKVLFPGGARKEKGFILSVDTCASLKQDPNIQPFLRARLDRVSGPELTRAFHHLDKSGIEVIDGDLSDAEFIGMLENADIVVIPYYGEAFRRRTSGILVDSMLLGKPVVVLEDTWLADIVAVEGTGQVAKATPDDVARAVRAAQSNFDLHKAKIEVARKDYLGHTSWSSLVDFAFAKVGAQPQLSERLLHSMLLKASTLSLIAANSETSGLRSAVIAAEGIIPEHDQVLSHAKRVLNLRDVG
ncbi:MAG: glycosyltransferase [Alteromonadaceae bacterium]|nr:glycosyltransferase [Alteromonadaceae bacterium]